MKFVMSYSCGKDSTLALSRLKASGGEPVGLLIMVNEEMNRSWFHGADYRLLEKYSRALDIPLLLCPSSGDSYADAFEEGLRRAGDLGAEAVGFGDIDILEHRLWCEERCFRVGLAARFPLWQKSRSSVVEELIDQGYCCLIKSIDNRILHRELLGRPLNREIVEQIRVGGADVCGENGEYHTLTVDGPIFRHRVSVQTGRVFDFAERSVIEIV